MLTTSGNYRVRQHKSITNLNEISWKGFCMKFLLIVLSIAEN